jgi:predicted metal-dependent HD superfamily phosphohydrolase
LQNGVCTACSQAVGGLAGCETRALSEPFPSLHDAFALLAVPAPLRVLIVERHSEPQRHYHTLRHIDLMLGQLPAGHPFTREMIAATLFHDIIYDPLRSDNEELSLTCFRSVAGKIAPGAALDEDLVSAMILATKGHQFRDGDTARDQAINHLLKADLSILWHADPPIYEWYAEGVRKEYAFVPDDQFREARSRILTTLRDDLLRSGKLTRREGSTLRRNIAWELDGAG